VKKTAIYALTPRGARLGRTLADKLNGDLFLPGRFAKVHGAIAFDGLLERVAKGIFLYPRQIFITAAGIAVRAIAPHLKRKDRDPAVIVLDQDGEYVVSLVSGHLGGANELARKVAQLTGGKAVITTATDTAGVSAIDVLAKERNLSIANLKTVKSINMALLEGKPVQVFDPEDRLGLKHRERAMFAMEWINNEDQWINGHPGVWVTWKSHQADSEMNCLILHPRCLVAGVGCNRGTKAREILNLIKNTFQDQRLSLGSLRCLTTIEAKRDEQGLVDAAEELNVALMFFGKSDLESVKTPHPSSVVKKHMGVSSVCEATALLKSGKGRLLVPKTKSRNATLAVALES
jgi:cobalt-precorrin 5A hydrolase